MSTANEVEKLHRNHLKKYPGILSLIEVLEEQAQTLLREHRAENTAVCIQISNYLPNLVGAKQDAILRAEFNIDDARLTIAREHGFEDWEQVQKFGRKPLNRKFENAVNAVVCGDADALKTLLTKNPGLAHETSQYGHHATLLHYVSANGVETWRQKVPPNAVEITRLLLAAGADVHAKADVYGGRFDTIALLMSSAHPAEAGLTDRIAAVLKTAKKDIGD